MMARSLYLTLTVLSASTLVSAAEPAFVSCASQDFATALGLKPTDYMIYGYQTCSSICYNAGASFAWYHPDYLDCYCTMSMLPMAQLAPQPDVCSGTNLCGYELFAGYVVTSTFELDQCYTSFSPGSSIPPVLVNDAKTCFSQCREFEHAVMARSQDQYSCYCTSAPDIAFDGEGTCDVGTVNHWMLYSHTAGAAAGSGFVKRQMRERLIRNGRKRAAVCPEGTLACKVSGVNDAFECIDPAQELESCGGCVAGTFNSVNSTVSGTDCSTIPGVALGGVTCLGGQCLVSACQPGWTLDNFSCVRA
ncbi:hypothetical protein IAU60_006290 [Kwoniella sp. DSM 27419]